MSNTQSRSLKFFALGFALIASSRFAALAIAEPLVKDGDVIAICGDSITEQKQYSVFMEDYLRMCQPAKVKVVQFGWGGETAQAFLSRQNDALSIKPTLATTCYGMNDGKYNAVSDEVRKAYREPLKKVVENFKNAGARVIVGSPGAVDYDTFKRAQTSEKIYNNNLATLGQEAKAIAEESGQTFADVITPMLTSMYAAKQALGAQYHVGGGDGVHPAGNGHLIMAYAFLKAMGFDGDLGTITVDVAANTATATSGHKVTGAQAGAVTLESTTYPFCVGGTDPKNPAHTASILPYTPFYQDLSRLTLKTTGGTGKYKVTWGEQSKEFTADQLNAGVNIAAEFATGNPFSEPFNVVERAIREKQNFETFYFKNLLRSINQNREKINDEPAVTAFLDACLKRHAELEQSVIDAKKPVTHTIKIEAVQ